MDKDSVQFVDHETDESGGGGNKFDLSYKQIVLEQYQTILRLGNAEMRGGYMTHVVSMGTAKEVYIEDAREKYANSIFGLYDVLLPRFDRKMEEKAKEWLPKYIKLGPNDKEEKRALMRELFQALSQQLGRKRFFEIGRAVGTAD